MCVQGSLTCHIDTLRGLTRIVSENFPTPSKHNILNIGYIQGNKRRREILIKPSLQFTHKLYEAELISNNCN